MVIYCGYVQMDPMWSFTFVETLDVMDILFYKLYIG